MDIDLKRKFVSDTPNIAELLLHFFGSNPYYAMAKNTAGEVSYQPVKQQMTAEIVQSHLSGEIVVGSYHLNQDNTVNWFGWDIDSVDNDKSRDYATKILSKLGDIPHAVELSGGKGYHILVFLTEPIPADRAKQIVEFVRDSQGLPKTGKTHVECYPKQASLTKHSPMGNLLKLPLGEHPRTHERSRFVNPDNGWENGPPLNPEQVLTNLATPEDAMGLIKKETDTLQAIAELLSPYWMSGERHNSALYLSGYLAHLGWGIQDVTELVQKVCTICSDEDVANRLVAVKDTFISIEEGEAVKGFSGLNEILPGAVLKTLSELATKIITPTIVKQIDSIRLSKGAAFEKVRASASIVWMDLHEKGEIIQTISDECFWYDMSTHLLTSLESEHWRATLHNSYGLNPVEAFGRQVTEAVKLRALGEARMVTVQNKTVWNGEKLFLNLGTEEVYILDGETIETSYNGECGYMFETFPSTVTIVPDFDNPVNIWDILVNDLNFSTSSDAPASPEEQKELLKGWMLSFFFQEIMPTKPLLLAMGVPGSGKTTAIRRILKVFEGPDAEVLEVAGDKPDSLRASIASHKLLALDNLEKSGSKWLVDTLNRLATGANIELRKLYKTNETFVLKPNCFVAMSAVSMPFSEETLFSRILPLEMQQLNSPLPEYLLQKELLDSMNSIWADLLNKLNIVIKHLKKTQQVRIPPITSRLADFTIFCKRIEHSEVVDGETLLHGLRSLVDRQRIVLMEASPFIAVLEQYLDSQDPDKHDSHTLSELYGILEPLARARKLVWRWNNSSSLERHISAMEDPLKKLYNAKFTTDKLPTGREVLKVKFG